MVESCRGSWTAAWTGKTLPSAFSTPHLQKQHHLFESKCASTRSFAAVWEGNVGMAVDCGMIAEDDH